MKSEDIVIQLQNNLPRFSNQFSETFTVSSMTSVGTTVTVVTDNPHGLSNGDKAIITGTLVENPFVSLSNGGLGLLASGETTFDHDQKLFQDVNFVTVDGANESEYNGTFVVTQIPNRRNLSYVLTNEPSGAATGTPFLLEDRIDGYNGAFDVTVTDTTTFTYEVTNTPAGDADTTNALVNTEPRISRVIDDERAERSYTQQAKDNLWLFVSLQDNSSSRDRHLEDDFVQQFGDGTERRIQLIRRFNVDVYFPARDNLSGAQAKDDAEDIRTALYRTLIGFQLPSSLQNQPSALIVPIEDGTLNSKDAFYVHRFVFGSKEQLTADDTFYGVSRAFYDISTNIENEFDVSIATADIDLDEEPL